MKLEVGGIYLTHDAGVVWIVEKDTDEDAREYPFEDTEGRAWTEDGTSIKNSALDIAEKIAEATP